MTAELESRGGGRLLYYWMRLSPEERAGLVANKLLGIPAIKEASPSTTIGRSILGGRCVSPVWLLGPLFRRQVHPLHPVL